MDSSIHRYATIVILLAGVITDPAQAQVIPDNTLPTVVNSLDNRNFVIEGGSQSGSNLFHSFSQFSVPTNGSAAFNNTADVLNIFSRVTGGNASSIDGLMQVNGTANLFLLNPSGLLFGPNARLNIGGSFVGTTARSIKFSDSTEFSTSNPAPLLTMSVPIGLQMGTNSGAIQVNGNQNDGIVPQTNLGLVGGLGRSFILAGNGVTLNGGVITAPSGRLELSSVGNGLVEVTPTPTGFQLGYGQVQDFQDISLLNRSSLWNPYFISNPFAGIQLAGRDIRLDQSQIAAASLGQGQSADMRILASRSLSMGGVNLTAQAPSAWIVNQVSLGATANGGAIHIQSPTINLQDGAAIQTLSLGIGNAGAINVTTDRLSIQGEVPSPSPIHLQGLSQSRIASENFAIGNGGDIKISARQVQLSSGGQIRTSVAPFASGQGGNLFIDVADSLITEGVGAVGREPTAIVASTIGRGQGGNLQVTAGNLSVLDGSALTAYSFAVPNLPGSGTGSTGSLQVNVRDTLIVSGFQEGGISSFLGTNTTAFGNAGDVIVNAKNLLISNLASLTSNTIANSASLTRRAGDSGNLILNADRIDIISGSLGTFTFSSGNAQNALIQARQLTVQRGGILSTSTATSGNAGDLTVRANDILVSGLPGTEFATFIGAGAPILDEGTRIKFRLPNFPTGNTGKLEIISDRIRLENAGQISVLHAGTGNAGELKIDTGTASLNNGRITAATVSGTGGNLNLKVRKLLRMEQGSQISVESAGLGDGGNIDINGKYIIASGNSDIVANAIRGNGGNIALTSRALIGIQPRPQLTPDNDITASSAFGVSGTVQVSTIGVNPSSGLIELPVDTIDPSQKIATGCSTKNDSSFVATGRGGMPENPMQVAKLDRSWSDLRAIADTKLETKIAAAAPIEATALVTNAQGQMELIGEGAIASNPVGVTCSRQ